MGKSCRATEGRLKWRGRGGQSCKDVRVACAARSLPYKPMNKQKRRYGRYSSEQVAAAVAYATHSPSVLAAADDLDIPRTTLASWQQQAVQSMPSITEIGNATQTLTEKLDAVANTLVDSLTAKIDSATLAGTATALGIVIDKSRLLKGESTSNQAHLLLTESEAIDRAGAIRAAAEQRLRKLADPAAVQAEVYTVVEPVDEQVDKPEQLTDSSDVAPHTD